MTDSLLIALHAFASRLLISFPVEMEQILDGGARGVMVIVVGNGHGDTSSNPGRG